MQRRRRRWWTLMVSLAAALVVLAATLSLLFSLAVNAVPGYRDQLQSRVAEALGHPVRIGSMALTWRRLQPSLDFREIAVLGDDGQPLARFQRLRLGFDLGRLVTADLAPSVAEIYGLELTADIDALGHFSLRGFGAGGGAQDRGAVLRGAARFRRVSVRDSRLTVYAFQLGGEAQTLGVADAEVRHHDQHYSLQAQLLPPAELAAGVKLSIDLDGDLDRLETWQGAWSLAIDQVRSWPTLAQALKPGVRLVLDHADLRLSGHIEGGQAASLEAHATAATVSALHDQEVLARVSAVAMDANSLPEPDAWRTDISKLELTGARGAWPAAHGSVHFQAAAQGVVLDAALDSLRLDDVAPWLTIWKNLPLPDRLRQLHGDVGGLALHYQHPAAGADSYTLRAQLADTGLTGAAGEVSFAGLAGTLSADQDGGHLVLVQAPVQMQLPDVFEQPLPPAVLSGDFSWRHGKEGWQLGAQQFDWNLAGVAGHGRFALALPAEEAQSPVLQLQADFTAPDVIPLKPYMPKDWGAGTRSWLNRALLHGAVGKGHLELSGPLADYPYDKKPDGHWALDLEVVDATLAYAPGWPQAEHLHAQLKFRGNGLQIHSDGAKLGGNSAEHIDARIADFNQGLLVVDGSTRGDAARTYAFLRASPIAKKLSGLLGQTETTGPAAVDVHLEIPLKQDDPDVLASGVVHFDGDSMRIRGLDQPVQDLKGDVAFGGAGLRAEALQGRLYNTVLAASIAPEAGSPDGVLLVQFDAPAAPADGLLAAFTPDWLRARLSGSAHWQARLPFSGAHSGQLVASSDLRGLDSTLPEPLDKEAADSLPLTVTVGEGAAAPASAPLRILVDAGERARVALRLGGPKQAVRAVEVHFGAGSAPRAEADGLVVNGAPAELDAGGWSALLNGLDQSQSNSQGQDQLSFRGADLTPQRLYYRGAALLPTHLVVTPNPAGWSVQLDGAGAQGTLAYTRANGGLVQARLGHAALEPLGAVIEGDEEDQAEQAAQQQRAAKAAPFDPAAAPLLDLDCASLKVGDADLGHLVLRSQRIEGGQSLAAFKFDGGQLVLSGSGDWTRQQGQSSADLSFDFSSPQVGPVLKALGYAQSIDAKQAKFTGSLRWPPQAAGLELAQTEGDLKLSVQKGTIKAVEPGAGRVLGLLNVYALPRRLLFDFHDVAAKGLGFDDMSGSFKLAGGQAQTDDLKLVSPSMRMEVKGRIGLATRDYDEQVTVYPDVSTEVIVGAALVNPIAGGVALLAQQIFNKPFNKLAKFSYHLSGSWENPEVKPGEAQDVPGAAPAPEAAPQVAPKPPADEPGNPG